MKKIEVNNFECDKCPVYFKEETECRITHEKVTKMGICPTMMGFTIQASKVHLEKYLRPYLDKHIDKFFADCAEDLDLTSGDWSPDQHVALVHLKDEIMELAAQWARNNQ